MYKQVDTDDSFETWGGSVNIPVATLADEYGGRCQVAIDDHCYVLYLKRPNGLYRNTAWIFEEVFEVLRTLPTPSEIEVENRDEADRAEEPRS